MTSRSATDALQELLALDVGLEETTSFFRKHRKLLASDPQAWARSQICMIRYARLGANPTLALKHANQAVRYAQGFAHLRALALAERGIVLSQLGQSDRARIDLARAQTLLTDMVEARDETLCRIAEVLQAVGYVVDSTQLLQEAFASGELRETSTSYATSLIFLAQNQLLQGEVQQAHKTLEKALEAGKIRGEVFYAMARGVRGVAYLFQNDSVTAEHDLAYAVRTTERFAFKHAYDSLRPFWALALARCGRATDAKILLVTRRPVDLAVGHLIRGELVPAELRRELALATESEARGIVALIENQVSNVPQVTVMGECDALVLRNQRIALKRRPVLRRIMLELIKVQPRGCTADTLAAALWPEFSEISDGLRSRVYVAIATLRKIGLRDIVVLDNGTYQLAAEFVSAV